MKIQKLLRKLGTLALIAAMVLSALPICAAANTVTVSFRLIGADRDGNYVTWIPTTQYTVSKLKSKVGSVLKLAADEHGLTLTGLSTDYISAITAPEVLGGYTMAEFTNGAYSGWMYTINGSHPGTSVNNYYVSDGDELIFHYVNDYRTEVEDWSGGSQGSPATWNGWLDAEDTLPSADEPEEEPDTPTREPEDEPETEPDVPAQTPDDTPESEPDTPAQEPDDTPEQEEGTAVSDLITSIDALTITKANARTRKKLEALEESYDALTKAEQAQITNAEQLTELRDAFDDLLDEAEEAAEEELEEYADELDKDGWSKDQKEQLEELVEETLEDLSEAEDTDELDEIMEDAKEEMDVLSGKEVTAPVPVAYLDVAASEWFYADVQYMVQEGLMKGITDTAFSPDTFMTRSMLVTVLHRMAGSPAAADSASFADVTAGSWYDDAVSWANGAGIVTGYASGLFGTNDNVTREQIAVFLYRYAQSRGYDVDGAANLTAYSDHAAISSYALRALQWANAEGIIGGRTADTLAPGGTASRAEVCAMIHRFLNAY